jgi:hypothetical protein
MSLINLLKDPNAYRVGTGGQNAGSKKIPHGNNSLLGSRVSWDIEDSNAKPKFEHSFSHKSSTPDSITRGGIQAAVGRRLLDAKRIGKFLLTGEGINFITKQVLLQSQNPRPQKLYNLGINTLASVTTAGISYVRRGGPLPTFGDFDLGSELGLDKFGGGTYLGEEDFYDVDKKPKGLLREKNYSLGDPGKPEEKQGLQKVINFNNPFKPGRLEYNTKFDGKIDELNKLSIYKESDIDLTPSVDGLTNNPNSIKDFVDFKFEINISDTDGLHYLGNDMIRFRAFIDSINDGYSARHNEFKYNGRGEPLYTYDSFSRKISVGFKIAAQSRWEMKPLYQKLNYLVAQTAPNYSAYYGRIRTPYMYLTVGDWFSRIPGMLTSVDLTWQKDYIWEIALDKQINPDTGDLSGKDKDMLVLPHVLDVSINYQPIHSFLPRNSSEAPFIGPNTDEGWTNDIVAEGEGD